MTERSFRLKQCLLILTAAVTMMASSSCERTYRPSEPEIAAETENLPTPSVSQEPEADEEPLLLLDEEPLLLLEEDASDASSDGPVADNTRCFVCHANYMEEKIAVTHAKADIGCARCHGESDAHIADESWGSGGNGTAPDIMYPRDKIVPSCMGCHPKDDIDTPTHEPVFVDSAEKKVCTDCHGEHRLRVRRCKWK